jgi:opacity protein-like surface antigen
VIGLKREARRAAATAAALLCGIALAGSAQAGEFYGSFGLAITGARAEASGGNGASGLGPNIGKPTDTSPLVAGSLGFEFRMHELLPRRGRSPSWMPDIDLEDWVLRTELEAAGARSYDLAVFNGSPFVQRAVVEDVTLMLNQWVDLPLGHAIEAVVGRVRGIDDLTFNLGLGIGYKYARTFVANGTFFGKKIDHNMAWQAGTELGYALSDNVVLTGGYRYVGLGNHETKLRDSTGTLDFGTLKLDLDAHEFRAGIRVGFYGVRFPRGLLEPKRRYAP